MTAARFDVVAERRRLEGSSAAELRQRCQEIGGDEARGFDVRAACPSNAR